MDETALLQTIAEIAATFAGFVTLAAVVAKNTNSGMVTMRVLAMLVLSLIVVVYSLLPQLIASFEPFADFVWRFSSAIFATTLLCYWLYMLKRMRSIAKDIRVPILNKINTYFSHPICIFLLVTVVTGVWGEYAYSLYALVLLIILVLVGMLFVQIVYDLLEK